MTTIGPTPDGNILQPSRLETSSLALNVSGLNVDGISLDAPPALPTPSVDDFTLSSWASDEGAYDDNSLLVITDSPVRAQGLGSSGGIDGPIDPYKDTTWFERQLWLINPTPLSNVDDQNPLYEALASTMDDRLATEPPGAIRDTVIPNPGAVAGALGGGFIGKLYTWPESGLSLSNGTGDATALLTDLDNPFLTPGDTTDV